VWGGRRRALVGGFRSANASGCPPNLLTRLNKNQPGREILENGENPGIRKIRNNKQKCTKPELPKDPAKCGRTKQSQEKRKKTEHKTAQAKACTNR